jgi:hypothetical protein
VKRFGWLFFFVASCVGPLPSGEVLDRLEVLAVRATPPSLDEAGPDYPIQLLTLAADSRGVAQNATYQYSLCPPSESLPDAGPPNCLPPAGIALPSTGAFGDLDLTGALGSALSQAQLAGALSLEVVATEAGQQSEALKRVPVLSQYDYISAGPLSVDGVPLDGDQVVDVSPGSHTFVLQPSCNDGYCVISWYVTAGTPANADDLLANDQPDGPNTTFQWVAPASGTVVIIAVVRSSAQAGGVDWTWGTLDAGSP